MSTLAFITAILQAAPEELALVEALINIAKGTHQVVPVAQTVSAPIQTTPQTVTATPVVPEVAASVVIPPNGVKETLK